MTTDLIYHNTFTKHELSPGHPESPQRLMTALDYIKRRGLLDNSTVTLVEPPLPNIESIYAIHSKEYIDDLHSKSEEGGGFFTLDTSSNKFTYDAALLAAGGGIYTVDRIISGESRNGYVLCRPPGHHAEQDRAYGFCFINNIAVAAQHLLDFHNLSRVLIVDYDAHHGNGTQNTFYSSNQVLYIGLHQDGRTLFPGSGFPGELGDGTGENYNINLAMYPGAGDESYKLAFEELVIPVTESFQPDFILVSVGFDCHYTDPLTSLGLTTQGIAMMNKYLHTISESISKGRIAFFLEGGYNLDIVGQGSQLIMEQLAGEEITDFGDRHSESEKSIEYTTELIKALKERLEPTYWT
jgi:acetoin utilization deacetylase AcuC-like enzyme